VLPLASRSGLPHSLTDDDSTAALRLGAGRDHWTGHQPCSMFAEPERISFLELLSPVTNISSLSYLHIATNKRFKC